MNQTEMNELVDLYVAGDLPPALTALVETHLAADPAAAHDVQTLQETLTLLQNAPADEPSVWFTERLLDTLLRDQSGMQVYQASNQ